MSLPRFQPINIYNYLKQLGTTSTGHNNLSLLKELIDNSFDAGATNISVQKKEGTDDNSRKFYNIIYQDNGYGMTQQNLFKCVQLYSDNINSGIGKFGIGGASTLVNWCDIEDIIYDKFIIIITKTEDGITRKVKIDWTKCKTLEEYSNQVENSYTENDYDDNKLFKTEKLTTGTYIIIQTSERKYYEITEVAVDMINYINIGTTYQNYLEKGSAITLFDDSINHFALSDSILSDSIQVEIFKRKSLFAFSAKIGMKSICLKYNKHLNEIKISYDDLEENWKLICDVKLKLEMPAGIYTPNLSINQSRSDDQYNFDTWKSFIKFCHKNTIEDQKEINYLADNFIKSLYVVRTNNNSNQRGLGQLYLGFNRGENPTICKYIKKQLIFDRKNDDKLGLVQQNKSVIEWTNVPRGLKQFIKQIMNIWVSQKLETKLIELDNKEQEIRNFNLPLENSLRKKINFLKRMQNNKFIPLYPSYRSTPISAGNIILRALQKRMQKKEISAIRIQQWFRSQHKTSCPTRGFIKFQRFMKWSYNYYYITKIQRWFRTILLKKKLINYILSSITKRILRQQSANIIQKAWNSYKIRKISTQNENEAAIIIQKYIKRFLAMKYIKLEKFREKSFMELSINFNKQISVPENRNQFIKFKVKIIRKLNEMESLL